MPDEPGSTKRPSDAAAVSSTNPKEAATDLSVAVRKIVNQAKTASRRGAEVDLALLKPFRWFWINIAWAGSALFFAVVALRLLILSDFNSETLRGLISIASVEQLALQLIAHFAGTGLLVLTVLIMIFFSESKSMWSSPILITSLIGTLLLWAYTVSLYIFFGFAVDALSILGAWVLVSNLAQRTRTLEELRDAITARKESLFAKTDKLLKRRRKLDKTSKRLDNERTLVGTDRNRLKEVDAKREVLRHSYVALMEDVEALQRDLALFQGLGEQTKAEIVLPRRMERLRNFVMKERKDRPKTRTAFLSLFLIGELALFFSPVIFTPIWLPARDYTLARGTEVSGYQLSNDGTTITLLTRIDRTLELIPIRNIENVTFCDDSPASQTLVQDLSSGPVEPHYPLCVDRAPVKASHRGARVRKP